MRKDPTLPIAPPRHDPRETARLLKPQPPIPIPRRAVDRPPAGLIAAQILGARVHRGS